MAVYIYDSPPSYAEFPPPPSYESLESERLALKSESLALKGKATTLSACSNRVQAGAIIVIGIFAFIACVALIVGGLKFGVIFGALGIVGSLVITGFGISLLRKAQVQQAPDMRWNKVLLVAGVLFLGFGIWVYASASFGGLAVPVLISQICGAGIIFSGGLGLFIPALIRVKAQSIFNRLALQNSVVA